MRVTPSSVAGAGPITRSLEGKPTRVESEEAKGIFTTRHITCGLVEEDGELWDAENNLVAISRQIAQYRTDGSD